MNGRALGFVVAAATGLGLACAEDRPRLPAFDEGARPNVLVVLVDVLRRDHLGVYGYPLPTSPNVDAFAAESHRFDHAYSHSTWTKPSVATLFTSVYVDQHGLGRVAVEGATGLRTEVLPLEFETLAERFQAAGYRTGGFGANVHIGRKTGFGQGFERFYRKRLASASRLNRLFFDWLDGGTASAPFFAYLHYVDVHWPYTRRLPGETQRFGSTKFKRKPPETWTAVPAWAEKHLDAAALAALTARYDQEIAWVDAAFGQLLATLEEREALEETVIVFVADHGEGFNEHGELQHGFEPYPEVTGIPLLIRLPAAYRSKPAVSDEVVGLIDLMPTLLALVGLEAPAYAQGRNLVPLLLGEGLRERPIYLDGGGVRAMRSATHTVFLGPEGERECFDRARDPMELGPLAEEPAACERLATALEQLVGGFDGLAVGAEGGETVALDAEEIEALRALGYLN